MTFAGNWPIYARPVLEKVSHVFVIFYIMRLVRKGPNNHTGDKPTSCWVLLRYMLVRCADF